MKVLSRSVIYDNPKPQLCSRQAMFPYLCELPDGTILAAMQIGEAFEAVDCTSYLSRSTDGGETWSEPVPMFDKSGDAYPRSDACKVAWTGDRLFALGQQSHRVDVNSPIGNEKTGGVLDSDVFWSESLDLGRTWSPRVVIPMDWGNHTEATAPVTVAADGCYVSPVTNFPAWDGTLTEPLSGKLLRSADKGRTWTQSVTCMKFADPNVTCYEQRLCKLTSGTLVNMSWNENVATGERLHNHYSFSTDNGGSFSAPLDTGVQGQASSVMALPNERLLALHSIRRDTDRPGVYAYVVDFSQKTWNVVDEAVLWEPETPLRAAKGLANIFAFVRFGQPSAILLKDGDLLMTHWACEDGQYKTFAARIKL